MVPKQELGNQDLGMIFIENRKLDYFFFSAGFFSGLAACLPKISGGFWVLPPDPGKTGAW
jgi:hypothetical protein